MGRWAMAGAGILWLVLAACSTEIGGPGPDATVPLDREGPGSYDIDQVLRKLGSPFRCSEPYRDPSTIDPLPKPVAEAGCDADHALVSIVEYRSPGDVWTLHQLACDMGMEGYPYVSAGRWTVEIEDDYGEDVDPDDVLGPFADRLGVRVQELDCP